MRLGPSHYYGATSEKHEEAISSVIFWLEALVSRGEDFRVWRLGSLPLPYLKEVPTGGGPFSLTSSKPEKHGKTDPCISCNVRLEGEVQLSLHTY